MVSFENDTATYELFDDYWGTLPKIKKIEYKYVADATTRLSALQSGEADVIERVDSDAVSVLESDSNIVVDKFLTTECKHLIPKFKLCTRPRMRAL